MSASSHLSAVRMHPPSQTDVRRKVSEQLRRTPGKKGKNPGRCPGTVTRSARNPAIAETDLCDGGPHPSGGRHASPMLPCPRDARSG
ncbi:hypothetical protein STXM2123_278 [Streptomyces sp. F-3]|nr:hypothetical protein STXM2123_278 [Streptomyces sp. F-3]